MDANVAATTAAGASRATAAPGSPRIFPMPEFTLGDRLTPEQREFLDEWGFIRFRGFADPSVVRELSDETEEIDRRIVAEGRESIFGVPLVIGKRADGSRYVQRMVFTSLFGSKLSAFLQDPRFRGILEVAGHDYRIAERERDGLVLNHFRHEAGSAHQQLGWHTDSLRDVFYFEKPRRYLNVGFYLDDSPIAKGGLRVLPKTHEQPIRQMLLRKIHFVDFAPDADEFAIEARAGDLTIHDGRLWHRVAKSELTGDASRRRVMYLPLMNGPVKLKDDDSPTPFYFRLRRFARG